MKCINLKCINTISAVTNKIWNNNNNDKDYTKRSGSSYLLPFLNT